MNKYLEKIAEDKKEGNKALHAVGAHIVGGMTAGTAVGLAQLPVAHKVMAKVKMDHSDSGADLGTVKKFMKDNKLHKTTTFNTREHVLGRANFPKHFLGKLFKSTIEDSRHGTNPAFMPSRRAGAEKDFVVGVRKNGKPIKNHDILMHELGHAKDFQSHGKAKLIAGMAAKTPLYHATTVAALSNDKTRDYAPAVAAVPGLVTLREEGAANYHAYQGIKAHKGAAAANKYVRKLLPSQMGSYALGAAAPVAGAYVAKKLMDHWHPKKDK